MFIPMLYVFVTLAGLCIIIMSLGRQRVLNDSLSYWTGIAFINIFITNIFYILSWPGLLANGLPIIGHNTNTSAWIMIIENIIIATIFLISSLISWPGKSALRGSKWVISVAGWTFVVLLLNILLFHFENQLPLLVINNKFTLLSKSTVVLLLVITLPATILMVLRYRSSEDQFTGFVSLMLVLLLFTYIEQLMSVSRYALLWYLGRLTGVFGFIVLLFGLLLEYLNLYKREEEKGRRLSESERKTNEILNAITDSSFLIDKNWVIIQINDKALEFFGLKREDIVDKLYWDVFPVTLGTFIEDNFRKAVAQNITFSFEMHSMVKEAWIEMHLYPSLEGLTVRFRDITERKRIEEALMESEEKYRNIVESANEGIWIVDGNRKTTYANCRMASMLGYTVEEMLIKPWQTFVYENDIESSELRIRNRKTGTGRRESYEHKLRQKDGTPVWVLIHASLLYDNGAKYLGSISLITDITDLKQKELDLEENEIKLKELIATKDKFFNIIAHDLKNPFTSLIGSSELLVENIDQMQNEQIKTLAFILNESSKNGYGILLNLLDWSRSQTGMLKVNPEKVNLHKLIDDQMLALAHISSNKEIEVISVVNKDIQFTSDKNILSTILRNLISNALKFSYRKGSVTISASQNNSYYIISVRDNGIGISPEKMENIFTLETNVSTPGTENEQGTGLGLKLCKEFIQKIGGEIWVESVEKRGSEFKFSIPNMA